MSRVRVKGFKIFADRHGKMRCYHRKTGIAIDLKQAPLGSAEFFAECSRITNWRNCRATQARHPWAVDCRISSKHLFLDLAARTRSDYQQCLDYLKPIADTGLPRFDRGLIIRIRDKAGVKRGRRFGNYVKAVLSIIFAWGAERGYLAVNPAEKVKNLRRQKGAPEANRPWTDEECHAVIEAAPAYMLSGDRAYDVHRAWTERRSATASVILQERRNCHSPVQDRRASTLASPRSTPGNPCHRPVTRCPDTLRQL